MRYIVGLIAALSIGGAVENAHARAVSLADASYPPTYLVYLYPGASVTYADHGENCPGGGFFSDVSAYQWNGHAVGRQHHTELSDYWPTKSGRVTFDGITFRNRSHRPVLVAGWCE